jgi:Beta-propeller repeat
MAQKMGKTSHGKSPFFSDARLVTLGNTHLKFIMKTSVPAIFRMATALLMLCIPLESISQTPALIWAKKANNATDDIYCYDIAIDPTGYVYTVGYFGGTVDFDPGAATSNITATGGGNSAFIQKLDTNGNFVWARAIHSSTSNLIGPYAVSLDAVGNVYVSGYFLGTADFNPGAATANMTALAPWDAFVLKLNAGGNYVWAKQFGNAGAIMWTDDNVVDAANNVYTAGGFDGTVDFNPAAAVFNMTSSGYDSYVQKMDAAGNFLWAKKNTSTGSEIAHSISVDNSSNVVVGGYFSGPVLDLDPNAGVSNFSLLGVQDLFIQKLSSAGNLVWAKTFMPINRV